MRGKQRLCIEGFPTPRALNRESVASVQMCPNQALAESGGRKSLSKCWEGLLYPVNLIPARSRT